MSFARSGTAPSRRAGDRPARLRRGAPLCPCSGAAGRPHPVECRTGFQDENSARGSDDGGLAEVSPRPSAKSNGRFTADTTVFTADTTVSVAIEFQRVGRAACEPVRPVRVSAHPAPPYPWSITASKRRKRRITSLRHGNSPQMHGLLMKYPLFLELGECKVESRAGGCQPHSKGSTDDESGRTTQTEDGPGRSRASRLRLLVRPARLVPRHGRRHPEDGTAFLAAVGPRRRTPPARVLRTEAAPVAALPPRKQRSDPVISVAH